MLVMSVCVGGRGRVRRGVIGVPALTGITWGENAARKEIVSSSMDQRCHNPMNIQNINGCWAPWTKYSNTALYLESNGWANHYLYCINNHWVEAVRFMSLLRRQPQLPILILNRLCQVCFITKVTTDWMVPALLNRFSGFYSNNEYLYKQNNSNWKSKQQILGSSRPDDLLPHTPPMSHPQCHWTILELT